MAYQFCDGFDAYGTAYNLTSGYPWDLVNGTCTVSTSDVRFSPPAGTSGGAVVFASSGAYLRKNLLSNQPSLIVNFGFKWTTSLPGSNAADICALWDTGTYQVTCFLNSNGQLQFSRGNPNSGGTIVGTATPIGTITPNVWYGLCLVVTIDPSAGAVALYLNGSNTPLINSSGLNTRNTANAYATQVSIGNSNNTNGGSKCDDFWCWDSTGGSQNTFPGNDSRIITKLPSGAGNYTNWTPNGLASNWQCVSQAPPNIADYVSNNTPTTKDSYALPSIGLGVAPYAFVVRQSVTKDDASAHTAQALVRSSSTDGVGTAFNVPSSYAFFDTIFVNDPSTSTAWTASGADAAQVGIVLTS